MKIKLVGLIAGFLSLLTACGSDTSQHSQTNVAQSGAEFIVGLPHPADATQGCYYKGTSLWKDDHRRFFSNLEAASNSGNVDELKRILGGRNTRLMNSSQAVPVAAVQKDLAALGNGLLASGTTVITTFCGFWTFFALSTGLGAPLAVIPGACTLVAGGVTINRGAATRSNSRVDEMAERGADLNSYARYSESAFKLFTDKVAELDQTEKTERTLRCEPDVKKAMDQYLAQQQ